MTGEMMRLVLDAPDQLRWGTELPRPQMASADHVVLLGMGGSAMAARAAALLASPGPAVVVVHQGYGLPAWAAARHSLVVVVSYSGNTEETLSGFEEALASGLQVAAISSGGRVAELAAETDTPWVEVPGGMQPRAAVGYQLGAAASVLHGADVVDDPAPALAEAADVAATLLGDGGGPGFGLGSDLAEALLDRIPLVIGGAGPAALAAGRWMTQINENAKRVAFAGEVPEMSHNTLEALAAPGGEPGRIGVVALSDPGGHPRNERRLRLIVQRLGGEVDLVGEVAAQGEGLLARLWSLISVGDVASVVMAELAGVDPTPVEVLEEFKIALREADSAVGAGAAPSDRQEA